MENSEVVEEKAAVGLLIDPSESEPASENVENVVTFFNESPLPDTLSIADDNVSEDSDNSVVIIDDNVSRKMQPVYSGIFYGGTMLGPALGYVLGGQFLRLYVDFDSISAEE